jgi:hypothetical protein
MNSTVEGKGVRVMAFNTTFNNISAISWCSVFLLEETAVTGENQRPEYCDEHFWNIGNSCRKLKSFLF